MFFQQRKSNILKCLILFVRFLALLPTNGRLSKTSAIFSQTIRLILAIYFAFVLITSAKNGNVYNNSVDMFLIAQTYFAMVYYRKIAMKHFMDVYNFVNLHMIYNKWMIKLQCFTFVYVIFGCGNIFFLSYF